MLVPGEGVALSHQAGTRLIHNVVLWPAIEPTKARITHPVEAENSCAQVSTSPGPVRALFRGLRWRNCTPGEHNGLHDSPQSTLRLPIPASRHPPPEGDSFWARCLPTKPIFPFGKCPGAGWGGGWHRKHCQPQPDPCGGRTCQPWKVGSLRPPVLVTPFAFGMSGGSAFLLLLAVLKNSEGLLFVRCELFR